jgi:ATP-dependent DNA helicase RecG
VSAARAGGEALARRPPAPPGPARDTPIRFLAGVGPARAERLAGEGFAHAGDLLLHLPARYEDRRRVVGPREVDAAGSWTLRARLVELRRIRTRRRGFVLVRARAVDPRGALPVVWFNQPYLLQRLVEGGDYLLHGAVRATPGAGWELVNPSVVPADGEEGSGGRIVPVYASLAGLGPAPTARLVARALPLLDSDPPPEVVPAGLRRRYGLPEIGAALRALHLPGADADLAALGARASPAHLRLIYGELLELQLELALLRAAQVSVEKQHAYTVDNRVREAARAALPFRLTAAQKRVTREIVDDLLRPQPMLRLLQGDVGSGKTIVAALALLIAVESGLQAAFMAPTELLAEQQFAVLERLLGARCRLALLTGSQAGTAGARAALAAGRLDVAVGTHALIQRQVAFARLGLAVIDEQHRFGVEQRRLLQGKGDRPDVLVMTATPIPRSLALTLYGDLEISVLDELPPGRQPVATELAPAGRRREVYARLREAVRGGAQAYVVVPLIEESEEIAAASIAELAARVRELLGDLPAAVLHGRLAPAERERVMAAFAGGEVRLLVATTVVEVGLDVPAATWMVIESAERFGLAQLHQLRGRIGRGAGAARCVAIHGRLGETAARRLELFASARDGFAIAEADLELRGPGDLLGKRQSGLPRLRIADLAADRVWVERARADARELLPQLDRPEQAALAARVRARLRDRYEAFSGG